MFGIGETELVIIVVFAFLLFGPDKLPGMGRTLGRVLRQFREASNGFTEVVQTNIMDPASEELEKSPKQRKREAEAENAASKTDGAADGATSADGEVAPKRETFAERKARLIAERKAAEEAAAAKTQQGGNQEDGQAGPEHADDVDSSKDVTAVADSANTGDANKPASEGGSMRTSAADLYAVASQKSSRMQAKDASQQEAAESAPGEEDGDA